MRKSFHQLKYLSSKWIRDRTQKIILLGTHRHMSTIKFFISKCFHFDDQKASIASSVLLDFQLRNCKGTPKPQILMSFKCFQSSSGCIILTVIANNFNKIQYRSILNKYRSSWQKISFGDVLPKLGLFKSIFKFRWSIFYLINKKKTRFF